MNPIRLQVAVASGIPLTTLVERTDLRVALWSSRVAFEWRFVLHNATTDCVDTCSPSDGCDGGDPPPPHPVAAGPDP